MLDRTNILFDSICWTELTHYDYLIKTEVLNHNTIQSLQFIVTIVTTKLNASM